MDSDINEYADYWTEDYYVLVGPTDNSPAERPRYSIIDIERHMYAIIEDDRLADQIIARMLDRGVKIFKSMKDLPARTIPAHWTSQKEMQNFDDAVGDLNLTSKQVDKLARHFLGKNMQTSQIREQLQSLIPRYQ